MALTYQIQDPIETIQRLLQSAVRELKIEYSQAIKIEKPAQASFGDYATSVALSIYSNEKENTDFLDKYSNPRAVAQAIADACQLVSLKEKSDIFQSITVAGPGFINFTLTHQYLFQFAQQLIHTQAKLSIAPKSLGSVIIEYLGPNTNKPLHIGHLRNGALGLAVGNLLKEVGWDVHFGTINNDRGLHIMKSVWGYLELARKSEDSEVKPWHSLLSEWVENQENWLVPVEMPDEQLQKPDHFVGHWYKLADTKAENPDVQVAWAEMLQTWEDPQSQHHDQLRQLWQKMNNWFYQGFQITADRLGIAFEKEHISYESEIYQAGKDIILDATQRGIFKRLEDGAVKVELEQFGLPDKILLRRDGTGIYMTFDIELTRRRAQFGAKKLLWVVGVDQQLYFQQLFAVCELLGYGKREDFYHLAYGMVRLPEGKMSSRKGLVVYADDLLDMAQEKATQAMEETTMAKSFTSSEKAAVVESVGVGAVKWTMLSQDPVSEITFDINESVSFKGFAGPYIQYTLARCHSVLEKAKNSSITLDIDALINLLISSKKDIDTAEIIVLRTVIDYFEVIKRSAQNYSPHMVALFLFETSQAFNTFYANCPIISEKEGDQEQSKRRLLVTAAVAAVLERGLTLLGITPVEKM